MYTGPAKKLEPYLNSPGYSLCVPVGTGHVSYWIGFTANYINSDLSHKENDIDKYQLEVKVLI